MFDTMKSSSPSKEEDDAHLVESDDEWRTSPTFEGDRVPLEEGVAFVNEDSSRNEVRCRDPFWAFLFLLNVSAIITLAVLNGGDLVNSFGEEEDGDTAWGGRAIVGCVATTAGFSCVLCLVWLWACLKDPDTMVRRSFTLWAAVYCVAALCFILAGQLWFGFVCLLGCMFTMCLYASAVHRMEFAASNLWTATQALKAHPSTLCITLFSILMSLLWSALCLVAVVGTVAAIKRDKNKNNSVGDNNSSQQLSGGAIFLFLVSFYWGGLVISNVAHVAISGTVASWWFHPPERQDQAAVRGSLARALTWSLGSVCAGSLLVAVLEATRSMLSSLRGQCGRCVVCCLDCVLFYVEAWTRYVNRFTFVYVAIYGDSFSAAGEKVNNLFTRRGFWATIMNDWILSRVFTIGMLGIALASSAFAFVLSTLYFDIKGSNADTVAIFGFLLGWLLASVVMGTLDSAVATVYVAFGEEPTALKRNHAQTFDRLYRGWNENYPRVTRYIVIEGSPGP